MSEAYNIAVNKIRDFSQNKIFELKQKFNENRSLHVKKFTEELFYEIDNNNPVYALATLVAQTTTIGRDDGYPSYNLDPQTQKVLKAAYQAGILTKKDCYTYIGKIGFYNDFSGISVYSIARNQDYESWQEYYEYKAK